MPISDPFRNPTGVIPRVRQSWIEGGAAGAHVLTGISVNDDRLIQVIQLSSATDVLSATDLTSEFTISDNDEIDNTGGTATTNDVLIVTWNDHDWGEFDDAPWQE